MEFISTENMLLKEIFFIILILVSFIIILMIYFTSTTFLPDKLKQVTQRPLSRDKFWCYRENEGPTLPEMGVQLPNPNRPAIFFIESSCKSRIAGKIVLDPRQACAVESAARMNPNSDIIVIFTSRAVVHHTEDYNDRRIHELLRFSNIYFRYVYVPTYAKRTLLDVYFTDQDLMTSEFALWHLSDALRLLTLWKYGGTYLDLDTIVIKNLESLPANYAGIESDTLVNNAVMNFDATGVGNAIAEYLLYDLRTNFNSTVWGTNGPLLMTRVLQELCNVSNFTVYEPEKCFHFHLRPIRDFYPIPWHRWQLYFTPKWTRLVLRYVRKSKVVHFWNKMSHGEVIDTNVPPNTVYTRLANIFCKNVYKLSIPFF